MGTFGEIFIQYVHKYGVRKYNQTLDTALNIF